MTNNLVTVSKDTFYGAIEKLKLDVNPELGRQPYDKVTGYTSQWKTRGGDLVGVKSGIEHLHNIEYQLKQSILSQYKDITWREMDHDTAQTYEVSVIDQDGERFATTHSSSTKSWQRLCSEVANSLDGTHAGWFKATIVRADNHLLGNTYRSTHSHH